MSIKSKIRDILLHVCPEYVLDYHINKTKLNYKIWGDLNFREDLDRNFKLFLSEDELSNNDIKNKYEKDILLSYWKFGSIPNEYFMFDFKNMDVRKKSEFLTLKRKDEICISTMGTDWREKFMEIRDKGKFYSLAKEYFNRDACVIHGVYDKKTYNDFVALHPCFIAKPNTGMCGHDTFIVKLDAQNEQKKEEQFDYLVKSGSSWILEDLIMQGAWAAQWNESSVNTIRLPSL